MRVLDGIDTWLFFQTLDNEAMTEDASAIRRLMSGRQ